MSAENIAHALGGARREGREWRCRCPLHGGRSLMIRDHAGELLVYCFGGCADGAVYAELCRLGLLDDHAGGGRIYGFHRGARDRLHDDRLARSARAFALWREARNSAGTIVELYLAVRGIKLADLPTEARTKLRYHPNCSTQAASIASAGRAGRVR